MARSTEDDFAAVVQRALQSAWGAALNVSTSEDFRDAEGNLDEAAVRRDRRQRQRPTNSGPPGSVPPG